MKLSKKIIDILFILIVFIDVILVIWASNFNNDVGCTSNYNYWPNIFVILIILIQSGIILLSINLTEDPKK